MASLIKARLINYGSHIMESVIMAKVVWQMKLIPWNGMKQFTE